MLNAITTAENLSIDTQRRLVLEELKTGDLDNLRAACERLAALAENHYSDLLGSAITLIAGASRLIDQVRARTIKPDSLSTDINQMIQDAVQILNRMGTAEPTGRIQVDNSNVDPEVSKMLVSLSQPVAK
jgi:hypothetical protein